MHTRLRHFDRWTVLAALAVVCGTTAAQGQSPFPASPPPAVQSGLPGVTTSPSWGTQLQPLNARPVSNQPANSQPAIVHSPFAAQPAAQAPLPDPVYWSQQLFLIPYKWDSGSTATDASAVKLFLSQDRGMTWSEIVSDAKPEVQFFNYHAPSDGEYLFAIQTIDAEGRAWPSGPHQAELRVIVDTQNPTITALHAQLNSDGSVTAVWQATDANLDTRQATVEYRTLDHSRWQSVPGGSVQVPAAGYAQGEATWQVPAGTEMVWVRLAVRDLAGNVREAGAEARTGAPPSAQLASSSYRMPTVPPLRSGAPAAPTGNASAANASSNSPFRALPPPPAGSVASSASVGWSGPGGVASNTPGYQSAATTPPPAIQHWPSDGESPVPLGSPRLAEVRRLDPPPASTTNTTVGTNSIAGSNWSSGAANNTTTSPFQLPQNTNNFPQMRTASARPFDNAATQGMESNLQAPSLHRLPSLGGNTQPATGATGSVNQQSAVQYLNSLEFEIGYDVDTAGTFGVTRVELWGTPDGGNSWRRLSVDTDNRSPILATVPAPGDYGLKIVVETAGGIDPVRPRPGDQPEMFVRIDTTPPKARLTGIRQGAAAEANQLLVDWQRPASQSSVSQSGDEKVTLQYSSTPTGPWATAASNLPNNGHYSWRLGRHLPQTFYVRIEIRDTAGNVASDQTEVPVTISLPTPSGRLGSVRALQ